VDGSQWQAIVDLIADASVVVDADGTALAANGPFRQLFGFGAVDPVGTSIDTLVGDDARERHRRGRRSFFADADADGASADSASVDGASAHGARADGAVADQRDRSPRPADLHVTGTRVDGTPVDLLMTLAPFAGAVLAVLRRTGWGSVAGERLALLEAVVGESEDAVYTLALDRRVTSWNRGARRLYGYEARDVLGLPLDPIVPDHLRSEALELFERVRRGENVDHVETERLRQDAQLVPISLSMSPVRDPAGDVVGVVCIARDITEQRLAQATLADSELRLREGESLAHVGSWSWDAATGAVQWSEEMHAIAGVSPFDIESAIDAQLLPLDTEDRPAIENLMRRAFREAAPCDLECSLRRPTGEHRRVYLRARPVQDSSGKVIGLRGICQDVTERHLVERRLHEVADRERQAAEELRRADAIKDDFLTTVSHELRTPLTSILGFGALLESESPNLDDEVRADLVRRVNRNAADMRRLVEGLLDFSRLQAGRVHVSLQPLQVAGHVEATVSDMGSILEQHRVEIDAPADVTVMADPTGFDHVLSNLLSNAAKFAPEGTCIGIEARAGGDLVRLSISDEGPGIPPEALEQVFERFFQLRPTATGPRGSGVGLAIVRQYVELMGGRVWAESEVGRGTTMMVELPRAPAT